ncbi:hypothetical protein BLOT_015353 [Blomia tropicalis]|nr:hypothetical protein BLOT_015353 [Blomia tropicalis]
MASSRRMGASSDRGSTVCMNVLITIFKVVLIIFCGVAAIFTLIRLVHYLQGNHELEDEMDVNKTQYWVNVACLVLVICSCICVVAMIATESLCGLIVTLIFMGILLGYKIYFREKLESSYPSNEIDVFQSYSEFYSFIILMSGIRQPRSQLHPIELHGPAPQNGVPRVQSAQTSYNGTSNDELKHP